MKSNCAFLYDIQVKVIHSLATLVAVTSECSVKRVICKTWIGSCCAYSKVLFCMARPIYISANPNILRTVIRKGVIFCLETFFLNQFVWEKNQSALAYIILITERFANTAENIIKVSRWFAKFQIAVFLLLFFFSRTTQFPHVWLFVADQTKPPTMTKTRTSLFDLKLFQLNNNFDMSQCSRTKLNPEIKIIGIYSISARSQDFL